MTRGLTTNIYFIGFRVERKMYFVAVCVSARVFLCIGVCARVSARACVRVSVYLCVYLCVCVHV